MPHLSLPPQVVKRHSHLTRRTNWLTLPETPGISMSVRPPQSFHQPGFTNTGFNVLEYELMSERAAALGRQGVKVEEALAALSAWNAERDSEARRESLCDDAADAVWALFIQREICGLRNNREIIKRYAIPSEVLSRVGAVRK